MAEIFILRPEQVRLLAAHREAWRPTCVPGGQIIASTVVYSDDSHFAFDPFDVLVGEHPLFAVRVTAIEAGVS